MNPLKWKSDQDTPLFTNLQRLPMMFPVKLQASRWLTRIYRLWSVITLTHMLFGSSYSSPAPFPLTPSSLLQRFDMLSAQNVFLPDIRPSPHHFIQVFTQMCPSSWSLPWHPIKKCNTPYTPLAFPSSFYPAYWLPSKVLYIICILFKLSFSSQ